MKKKLLLTLLLAMLACFGISAQDEPQTAPPIIEVVEYDTYVDFVFTCEEDVYQLDIAYYVNNVFQGYLGGPFPWNMDMSEGNCSCISMDRTYEPQYVVLHVTAWGNGSSSGMVEFEYTIAPMIVNERTSAPIINGRYNPEPYEMSQYRNYFDWYAIDIENTDVEDVTIYYRYHYTDTWEMTEHESDWKSAYPGNGVIAIQESACGWVEAYAQAEHKFVSDTVRFEFYYDRYPSMQFQRYYDFIVDGIYYSILSDSTVAVSKHTIDFLAMFDTFEGYMTSSNPSWDYYETMIGANPCYYGDIVIPATVEYKGKTYTVTALKDFSFEECEMSSIQLPSTITSIGNCAFYSANVPEFTIPNSVTSIGEGAFAHFHGVTSLTIPESIESIPDAAFSGCENLVSLKIPESVTFIGYTAFRRCYSLKNIDIPSSVTSMGYMAFGDCVDLVSVTCHAVTPPEIDGIVDCFDIYGSIYEQATLFVPAEALEDYRNDWQWGQFMNIVPFIGIGPGDVNGDGAISIKDATDLIDELLSGGDMPTWMDVNGDGNVSIKDITDLIDMLLAGGN